jgi:hypothetical protein
MSSTIFGLVVFLAVLFVIGKVMRMIARFCSLGDMAETLGDSLALGSGDFSSIRED